MTWTPNQIWRWTHITFATLWLAELLFGVPLMLIEIVFGEALTEREVMGLPFQDALFVLLLVPVVITGFSKWPLYPWYKKRKSKSEGRFKFIGPWNGNQIWRWIHITTGSLWVVLLADGLFLEGLIFGEDEEALLPMVAFLIAFFGTIISGWAKWPIYPWYKKRKNRKMRAKKEMAAAIEEE
ncbi:MAG: hypothetical protein QGI73_03525 [Candidatus Thalassarchaeaceae archaeon]|nr:hypothetical protein [Euryarchaeota archaeon]MDP6871285.1 hypothetical protein [Candidatus Thalassarchaeaceae archaeon]